MRIVFFVIITILIFARYLSQKPKYNDGDRVMITTTLSNEPRRYSNAQAIIISGLKIYLPSYPEINYGDRLVVTGIVEGNKLSDAQVKEIKPVKNNLFRARKKIIDGFMRFLPEPHSSLLAGIVLGSKQALPADFDVALKKTGTMHVVVASGMNISLVANFLITSLVHFVSRKKALLFALIGIWLYSAVAGFEPPVIRAAVMGSMAFLAQATGRLYYAIHTLFISASLMLLVNPLWLIDIGFILSFVATLSLLIFEKPIRARLSSVPKIIREDLSTSLAAQIGVGPVIFAAFGQFNPLSPLVNALVLWTIPPVTVIGMIGGIMILYIPLIGNLIVLLSYPFTTYFISVVKLSAIIL